MDSAEGRTLLLIGDSHLTDTSTWGVLKLGPRLRAAAWRVTTHAVGGQTTRMALELPPPVSDHDWTIYCFGTNDCAPWKQVPLQEFSSNLSKLLLRTDGRRMVLGPPPVCRDSTATGRTRFLIERYSSAAAAEAAACDAVFVPLLSLLDERDLAEDGVHIDDSGYEKLAREVCQALARAG